MSLITIVTPWMLAGIELIVTMAIYFAAVPHSMKKMSSVSGLENKHYSFHFDTSLEDIVISSVVRVLLLSIAYGFGSGHCCHQPYFITAIVTSSFLIPYIAIKGIVTSLQPLDSVIILLLISAIFSIVHVVVAHATMKKAKLRWNMGLVESKLSWAKDEEGWVMASRHFGESDQLKNDQAFLVDVDYPREVLQDSDSRFAECNGVSVHYKEERPMYGECGDLGFAILLIHGFGGGAFAWRHLMRPLAEINCCRVVALDRPAFGLTSRPAVIPGSPNPYTLSAQKNMIIQFCYELGIKRVVLIGHSDGCILSLMVAAKLRGQQLELRSSLQCGSVSSTIEIGMSVRKTPSGNVAHEIGDRFMDSERKYSGELMESQPLLGSPKQSATPAEAQSRVNLHIASIVLLHPDFSTEEGPTFTNLLLQSKIGRKFLRPLLRTDMGEVASRRAWHDTSKLTNDVLQLYKAPLRIQGWDSALVEHTKVKRQLGRQQLGEIKKQALGLPIMVVTGEKDRITPPDAAASIAQDLQADHVSILPECGHISHEESPEMLLDVLVGFLEHMCDPADDAE